MAARSPVNGIAGEEVVSPDPAALAARVAEWLTARISMKHDTFRLVLSGGSTPRGLFTLLGSTAWRGRIDWARVELFWGDERFVPYDDSESNFGMARETLLAGIDIPPENVHPMPTNGTPTDAAHRYEMLLKNLYGSDVLDSARPLFDVVLLGLGRDGHIASLLPGEPILDERIEWVAPVMHGRSQPRITLTYPAIESSTVIAFLVTGSDKAQTVRAARAGDVSLPAARIKPKSDVLWFLDSAASKAS